MSMAFGGGGGGGGRGFSYRSAHQQGQDGPNRRGRGQQQPSRRRRRRQQPRKHSLQCAADIFVPEHLRSVLIGKGGVTIQSLIKACSSQHASSSNAVTIHVPPRRGGDAQMSNSSNNNENEEEDEDDRRPVRVKADTVASLLHACWRILHVLVNASSSKQQRQRGRGADADEATAMTSMACHVRIPSNAPSLIGRLGCTSPFFMGGGGQAPQPPQQQQQQGDDESRNNHRQNNSSINSNTTMMLSVYCVQSFLDAQQVDTLVDNVRFANATVTAQYETVYQDDDDNEREHDRAAHDGQPSSLIFVYGTSQQQPEHLYEALQQATVQLWQQEQEQQLLLEPQTAALISNLTQRQQQQAFTVGTYNLLHPVYAERYQEPAGVDRILMTKSNWLSFRVAAIYRILLSSHLDIYLLQEVDAQAFTVSSNNSNGNDNHHHHHGGDLLKEQLLERYEFIHFVHPGRSANDSVALLIRKDRFAVLQQESVPFHAKGNQDANIDDDDKKDTLHQQPQPQHYMCAAVVLVKDLKTQRQYRVASTHFCPNKTQHAEQTLLEFLAKSKLVAKEDDASSNNDSECDAIIWGGDCNNEYKSLASNNYPLFSAYTTMQDSDFHGKMNENENETQEAILTNQKGIDLPRHEQQSLHPQRRRYTRGTKCIDWIFFSTQNNDDSSNNSSSKSGHGRLQGCRSTISEAFVHATGRRLAPTGYPASDHLGEAVTLVYNDGQISQV